MNNTCKTLTYQAQGKWSVNVRYYNYAGEQALKNKWFQ